MKNIYVIIIWESNYIRYSLDKAVFLIANKNKIKTITKTTVECARL